MLEAARPLAADPQLAESYVAQRMLEGLPTLLEDLHAMRDEEQSRAWQLRAQPLVVDRRHHGLAGPGGGHEQVAVMAEAARDGDLLQEALLKRVRAQLGGGEGD